MGQPRVVLRLIVELRDPTSTRQTEEPFAILEQREGMLLDLFPDGERMEVRLAAAASELGIGAASFVLDNTDRLLGER